jgi:hypothetical protein
VLLAYTDESYDKGCYFTTAVILDERVVRALAGRLDRVAAEAAGHWAGALDPAIELHGYELFHAEGPWLPAKREVRARVAVYAAALGAIAEAEPHIVIRGVDVRAHKRRYQDPWDPHEVSLWHLLERIDEHARGRDERVLVIADELARTDAGKHRANLRLWQRAGTPGFRSSRLASIIDTIQFAPSVESRCLQAADLVSFLHFRRQSGVDRERRAIAANEMLWGRIEPWVRHRSKWVP